MLLHSFSACLQRPVFLWLTCVRLSKEAQELSTSEDNVFVIKHQSWRLLSHLKLLYFPYNHLFPKAHKKSLSDENMQQNACFTSPGIDYMEIPEPIWTYCIVWKFVKELDSMKQLAFIGYLLTCAVSFCLFLCHTVYFIIFQSLAVISISDLSVWLVKFNIV